jgi:outer membrane lipoprotein-sorting protein
MSLFQSKGHNKIARMCEPFSLCRARNSFNIAALLFLIVAMTGYASAAETTTKPEDIPALLFQRGKNLSAFKAVMNVTTMNEVDKSRQDIKGFLLYRRPSDFRFQGLAAGGTTLFELVIKSNAFELYVPQEGKVIKGDRECFGRKFPDVAEIESLIPMVLLQWRDVRFDRVLSRDAEKMVVRITFQGRVWGATLDSRNMNLLRLVRINPRGDIDLTADFGDFHQGADGWLPHKFEVVSPVGGWRTLAKISKIEINPFLVEKNFQIDPTFSVKTEICR